MRKSSEFRVQSSACRFFQTLELFSKGWNARALRAFNQKSATGNRKFSRGLTLVEVMLAIVILGIGSGTLMLATAKCLAVVGKARHYSMAQRLIHQVEVENPLPRDPEEFEEMADSGDFEEDGYSWEREVTMVDEEIRPGLFTVRTKVSWSSRNQERFEEAITYRYVKPKEKPAK